MSSTTNPRTRLASTPPTLPSSTLAPSVIQVHIATPPPSPSPFMKDFVANAQPPPTAADAICSTSTTSRFPRVANVRRACILVVMAIALLLLFFVAGPAAIFSANLFRSRFQHDVRHQESFAHWPMPTVHPAGLRPHRRHERIARQQSATRLNLKALSTPTQTSSSATTTSLATAPPIPTESPPLPTPFPQPFDDTLSGAAFTSGSCQQFFTTFTNDINFRSCRAFSFLYSSSEAFLDMLDPASTGFGNVTDPLQALTDVLWGICNTTTDQASCASRMTDYEAQLQTACKAELSQAQPLVVTALNGFRNFNLMRTAACLANQRTGSYCFVDAIAAADNGAPSDIYFYQLPLGTPLPGTGTNAGIKLTATCSTCIRSLMGLYPQYIPKADGGGGLDNGTDLRIRDTYQDASSFVSKQCGTGFATPINLSSTAARMTTQWGITPLLLWAIGVLFLQGEGW